MDQVPLPFVVSQESTYTTENDQNVHISAPSDALRKRQFTMHIFCNAGKGEDRDGYTPLICKGSPNGRRTQIEKLAYNNNTPMLFQKNAWVDTPTMKQLATHFVNHIKDRHNGLGVLLYCDNLAAHVADEVKEIFHQGNVFLCYFPPCTTESTQAIDAGIGRSIRCAIGNLLDQWLLIEENMEKWEGRMTASERRVLMSHIVAAATETVLKDDESRVGCFVRTGCLLEFTRSDNDDLIKPQGVVSKIVIPLTNIYASEIDDIVHPTPDAQDNLAHSDLVDDDVYQTSEGDILPSDIVVDEEDDIVLTTEEQLEDVGVIDSDDEFDLNG